MELLPFMGLGAVMFGMPRDEVLELLGEPDDRFRKGAEATMLTDQYSTLGLHIYFDERNAVDAIEAFVPCIVRFSGINLVGRPPTEVLDDLSSLDIEYFEDAPSFVVHQLGVALYAPGVDAEGDLIEAVAIFKSLDEIIAVYPNPESI